jgi:alkylation response protein AidB-like acyl-CoA dehydrogenase
VNQCDLLYSDTEDALRDSVRRLLADRCSPAVIAGVYDADARGFSKVWHELSQDLGGAGLLVPEALGGMGATAREAAVVMEEVGRAVAPVPFLSSAVLATVALLQSGETKIVAQLAEGKATAALVVPFTTGPDQHATDVSIGQDGFHGTVTSVVGALDADVLVVPVSGRDGLELHAVPASADGVTVSPVLSLDMTRPLSDIRFSGVLSSRIDSQCAATAVSAALEVGAALLASEQLGIAQWCFDTTVAYTKERKQFGRTIGSYQAIKHRLADLWVEVTGAIAAARYAADAIARSDDDATIAACLAQAYCSDMAVHVAEECIQLHGGIGMTWEYPAHLYLKRAKANQLAFGTGYHHRARLGPLIGLLSP